MVNFRVYFLLIICHIVISGQTKPDKSFYCALFVRNIVEFSENNNGKWQVLKQGDTLRTGDAVRTSWQSSVHLVDNYGNELIIAEVSKILLVSYEIQRHETGYDCILFRIVKLFKGALFIWSKPEAKNHSYRILTPTGTIENKGTRFFVVYTDSINSGEVVVTEGKVNILKTDTEENVEISKGMIIESMLPDKKLSEARPYVYRDMLRYMEYFEMEKKEFEKFTGVYLEELRQFKKQYNEEFEEFKKEYKEQ